MKRKSQLLFGIMGGVLCLAGCAPDPGLTATETTFLPLNNGVTAMSLNLGGGMTTHLLDNGVTGFSSDLGGGATAHLFSDGVTGLSTNYGNFTYHTFSNGNNAVTHDMGGVKYHTFRDGTTKIIIDPASVQPPEVAFPANQFNFTEAEEMEE